MSKKVVVEFTRKKGSFSEGQRKTCCEREACELVKEGSAKRVVVDNFTKKKEVKTYV